VSGPAPRGLRPKHARGLALALVVALIVFSNVCGHVGIDFGAHWDEQYQVDGLRPCIDNLVFLPQKYIYGGVYFLVGAAVLFAHNRSFPAAFLHDLRAREGADIIDIASYPSVQAFQRASHVLIDSDRYLIEARTVFFALSSLVILWVYLLMRRLHPGRYAAPLGAAAFVAGSWELQYHARFVAVDAVMAQVLTWKLLLLAAAWWAPNARSRIAWYLGAAIAAGLAFSCKATGLCAFLPVGLFPFLRPEPTAAKDRMGLAAAGLAVGCVTAVLLRPGRIIDPLRVVSVLRRESWEYGRIATHANLTSGLAGRVGSFLAWRWLAVPSPFLALSLVASAVAMVGVGVFVRQHPRFSLLGGVLWGALLLEMVSHKLLIVRNYLVFVPMLALGFGNGIAWLADALRSRPWVWRLAMVAFGLVFLVQERWLFRAAKSIRDSTADSIAQSAAADLLRSPQAIRLSPSAYAELAPRLAPRFRCRPADAARKDLPVAIHVKEHVWQSNTFGLSHRFYGPRDVNYDWYTSWIGRPEHSPLIIVSAQTALRQQVPAGEFGICEPSSTGRSRG
jgi:hypothetical protein